MIDVDGLEKLRDGFNVRAFELRAHQRTLVHVGLHKRADAIAVEAEEAERGAQLLSETVKTLRSMASKAFPPSRIRALDQIPLGDSEATP